MNIHLEGNILELQERWVRKIELRKGNNSVFQARGYKKNMLMSAKNVSLSSNLIKQLKSFDLRGQPSLSDENSESCCTFCTTISSTISFKKDQIGVLNKEVLGPSYH